MKRARVCKLEKALYGLRQAPKAWYSKIDGYLQSQGLTKSKEDPNLYFSIKSDSTCGSTLRR